MRRADRLFQIVQRLRRGKLTTALELSQWLEVSERTIYRDIADLMKSGVPIDGEAGLGYLMREGFDLPPLMFTTEEIVALTAGARMIGAWGGAEMARGAETALDKITSALPADLHDRAGSVGIHAISRPGLTEEMRNVIDGLEQAVTELQRIEIDYYDKDNRPTRRIVRPLGLWFWGSLWTLVAWCELRKDFRMFRIDRITASTPKGRYDPAPGQTLQDFYAAEAGKSPHEGHHTP